MKRRVARSLTFIQVQKLPIYKSLHRHGTQAHLSKWAQNKVTLVYARELPSSLPKKANLDYFNFVMLDTSTLLRQISYLGNRAGGEGSSRFREKQVIGKYCLCFTIFCALCSVIRAPISRSLSTLWIVDAVPQSNTKFKG